MKDCVVSFEFQRTPEALHGGELSAEFGIHYHLEEGRTVTIAKSIVIRIGCGLELYHGS